MSSSRKYRKETQRERLLAGMLLAAVRRGYAGANVAQVISHAGVSRPTFYEYFADKEDCFSAVHHQISSELLAKVGEAVEQQAPACALQAGAKALLRFAYAEPEQARFLVNETVAGGHKALDLHDRLVRQIAQVLERRQAKASSRTLTPDLPGEALVGGLFGLLAPRLRRNEYDMVDLAPEIDEWIASYNAPAGKHRWRTLAPGPRLASARHVSELALQPPPALPRGRPSLSPVEIARHQRERIVYATAEVAAKKGYGAVTIADITTCAGVDRRVFYAHFQDKQQAFLAAHELGFQQTMAVCARAYFSSETWPERIWQGLRAKTHFNSMHPVVAEIGYVEAHAVGSSAIQRVDDTRAAYNIFMHEGYLRTSSPPPPIALDAISATIYEIYYVQARAGQIDLLPRLTANTVYLVLAPFLGPAAANEFIDAKIDEERLVPPDIGPTAEGIQASEFRAGATRVGAET